MNPSLTVNRRITTGLAAGNEKLDIVFVGPLPPRPSGSAVANLGILEGLAHAGHRVRALSVFTEDTCLESQRVAERATPGLEIEWYRIPHFEYHGAAEATEQARRAEAKLVPPILRDLVGKRRPDVVITGNEQAIWHLPELAHEFHLPTVLWVHGGLSNFIRDGLLPPQEVKRSLEQDRSMDQIVTMAQHSAKGLRELGLDQVSVISNWVDMNCFSP